MTASVLYGRAADDYGEWHAFTLASGEIIYGWTCDCCSGLSLQYEAPHGVEFAALKLERGAVSPKIGKEA